MAYANFADQVQYIAITTWKDGGNHRPLFKIAANLYSRWETEEYDNKDNCLYRIVYASYDLCAKLSTLAKENLPSDFEGRFVDLENVGHLKSNLDYARALAFVGCRLSDIDAFVEGEILLATALEYYGKELPGSEMLPLEIDVMKKKIIMYRKIKENKEQSKLTSDFKNLEI